VFKFDLHQIKQMTAAEAIRRDDEHQSAIKEMMDSKLESILN